MREGERGGGDRERERQRKERERDFRLLQMVYCILAIGPYTNRNTKQNYAHT